MAEGRSGIRDFFQNALARGVLGAALILPYPLRVRLVGFVVSRVMAPLSGWNRRIRENLAHAMPETTAEHRRAIVREVTDNVGRTLIEIYSGEGFIERTKSSSLTGPGLERLKSARADGRPIVLVTAHFGNYDAVRGKLSREGSPMAALYRPMDNAAFNDHYVRAISRIATPVFPTDGRGISSLIRHLKEGGIIGIVADVASRKAPVLSFFGKPAHTPLSAAEWALKYDALLVPIFGVRQPDGLTFHLVVEDPIEGETPEAMMQAYNDVVEKHARANPGQWFWVHRRWKLSPAAAESAASAVAPPQA